MKSIRTLSVALLLALTATAVSAEKKFGEAAWPDLRSPAPAWVATPDIVIDVKWTRIYSPVAELIDGVCHLYYTDFDEQAMFIAQGQVEQCIRKGGALTTDTPGKGVRRLHIYKVRGSGSAEKAWNEFFDTTQPRFAWQKSFRETLAFYYEAKGACMIVANYDHAALGHEIKHCYDGNFHSGRTLVVPPMSTTRKLW